MTRFRSRFEEMDEKINRALDFDEECYKFYADTKVRRMVELVDSLAKNEKQFTIRFGSEFYEKLKRTAELMGRSINDLLKEITASSDALELLVVEDVYKAMEEKGCIQ